MSRLVVLAVEGDDFITPTTADAMRLPFHEGWEKWAVYELDARKSLKFIGDFTSYEEAENFIEQNSITLH